MKYNKIFNLKFTLKYLLGINDNVSEYRKLNIYNTDFLQNALLVHITEPFQLNVEINNHTSYGHTNFKESKYIAQSLKNTGFNVDVIDFDTPPNFNLDNYDLIIGFGEALEQSFYSGSIKNPIRIFYGTGQHPHYANRQSIITVHENYVETGIWLGKLSRVVEKSWPFQLAFSDIIVSLGNEYVRDTYRLENSRISVEHNINYFTLNCFYHQGLELGLVRLETKSIHSQKNIFCWFGSGGSIHKGLFKLISVIQSIINEGIEIELLICGLESHEKKALFDAFGYISFVTDLGKLNLSLESDREKLKSVSFNIFPSVSEGGSPSILNLGAVCGIPTICGKEVGLDEEVIGIQLNSQAKEELYSVLKYTLEISNSEYSKICQRVYSNIIECYTESNYLKNWNRILHFLKR